MNRRNLILIGYGFDEVTTDYVRQTIFHLEKNNFVVSVNPLNRQESFFLKQLFTTGRIGPFFHEWSANHYQYTPQRILPFARFALIKKINICIDIIIIFVFSFLKRKINVKSKKILWIFHPWVFTHYFLDIKFIFNCSLYDCVDYYNDEIFDEKKICSAVDLIVVNSQTLYKKLSKFKRKMILVVQGFDHKLFSSSIDNNIVKKSIIKTIGYVGGINNRLDYELLYSLVISNPQIRFVFCGPIFDITFSQKKIFEKITAKKNVLHFSRKKSDIPGIIQTFDICIIPYDCTSPFNRFSFPMKLMEYFYVGKPVISSNIHEMQFYKKHVVIAKTIQDWNAAIERLFKTHLSIESKKEMKAIAEHHSWSAKINQISQHI